MKKIRNVVLILALFMSLNGCEKDPVEEVSLQNNEELTIDQAKAFVETQRMNEFILKSGKSKRKRINIRSDWNKSERSKNGNISVVETQIQATGRFGFATSDCMEAWNTSKNDAYLFSMSKLVVIKHKKTGEMYSFIMSIAANKQYLEGKRFKLWDNTYLKRDKNLTGYVLFHDLSGAFVNGWIYCDGQVTNSIAQPDNLDLPVDLKSAMLMQVVYEWVQECTDWYTVGSVNGEVVSITHEVRCTDVLVASGTYTTGGGNGGGSVGGGTSGGDTTGGYSPPAPCNCTDICPVCGKCKDFSNLKSAVLPGDGTTTTTPTTDPCEYCAGHTKEQTARSQLEYLKQRGGRELAEVFELLLQDTSLPMSDVYAIYAAIEDAYLKLKADYMMAVFSPDNVAQIFGLFFVANVSESTKVKALRIFANWEVKIVNPSNTAILQNGYYEVNGFKFTEYYYNYLWNSGRYAPSLIAREVLENATIIYQDTRAGFNVYIYENIKLVYNPVTKEIWHIGPL